MKIINPEISKEIELSNGSILSVELDEKIIKLIKEKYQIDTVDDDIIKSFFVDTLSSVKHS
jgi:hypothetical protein